MTISAVGAMAGNPELLVDLALLDESHQDRDVARQSRHAAQETEQHELASEEQSMRDGAMAKLAGGLIQGVGQIAQGACTLGESGRMLEQADAARRASDLTTRADQLHGSGQTTGAEEASLRNQATIAHQQDAAFGASAKAMEGWSQSAQGAATIGSALANYGGDAAGADAKMHERLAGAAREECDDLRSREQDASSRADRSIGRIDDAIRSRAQSLGAIASNIRA